MNSVCSSGEYAGRPLKLPSVTLAICSRCVGPADTWPCVYTTRIPDLFFTASCAGQPGAW